MFAIVTATAEFIGGGIRPYYTINPIRLFPNGDDFSKIVAIAEVLFLISILYYIINIATTMKRDGCKK